MVSSSWYYSVLPGTRWGQRLGQKKWEVSYWAQKCGKSPDFARNQDFLAGATDLDTWRLRPWNPLISVISSILLFQ